MMEDSEEGISDDQVPCIPDDSVPISVVSEEAYCLSKPHVMVIDVIKSLRQNGEVLHLMAESSKYRQPTCKPDRDKQSIDDSSEEIQPASESVEDKQPVGESNKGRQPIDEIEGDIQLTDEAEGEKQPTGETDGDKQAILDSSKEMQPENESVEHRQPIGERNEGSQPIDETDGHKQPTGETNEDKQPTGETNGDKQAIVDSEEMQPAGESVEDKQPIGESNEERQLVGETNGDIQPMGEADGDRQPMGEADGNKQPIGETDGEKQTMVDSSEEIQPVGGNFGDKQSIGERNEGRQLVDETHADEQPTNETDAHKQPTGETDGDKRPTGETDGDKRPTGESDRHKQPIENTDGDKQAIVDSSEEVQPVGESVQDEQPICEDNGGRQPVDETEGDIQPIGETDREKWPLDDVNEDRQSEVESIGGGQAEDETHEYRQPMGEADGDRQPMGESSEEFFKDKGQVGYNDVANQSGGDGGKLGQSPTENEGNKQLGAGNESDASSLMLDSDKDEDYLPNHTDNESDSSHFDINEELIEKRKRRRKQRYQSQKRQKTLSSSLSISDGDGIDLLSGENQCHSDALIKPSDSASNSFVQVTKLENSDERRETRDTPSNECMDDEIKMIDDLYELLSDVEINESIKDKYNAICMEESCKIDQDSESSKNLTGLLQVFNDLQSFNDTKSGHVPDSLNADVFDFASDNELKATIKPQIAEGLDETICKEESSELKEFEEVIDSTDSNQIKTYAGLRRKRKHPDEADSSKTMLTDPTILKPRSEDQQPGVHKDDDCLTLSLLSSRQERKKECFESELKKLKTNGDKLNSRDKDSRDTFLSRTSFQQSPNNKSTNDLEMLSGIVSGSKNVLNVTHKYISKSTDCIVSDAVKNLLNDFNGYIDLGVTNVDSLNEIGDSSTIQVDYLDNGVPCGESPPNKCRPVRQTRVKKDSDDQTVDKKDASLYELLKDYDPSDDDSGQLDDEYYPPSESAVSSDPDADLDIEIDELDKLVNQIEDDNENVDGDEGQDPKTKEDDLDELPEELNSGYLMLKQQMKHVTVPVYHIPEGAKRNYRKLDYCLFCRRPYSSKISKHYLSIHTDQHQIQQIILARGKARDRLLYKIRMLGNYQHNTQVIADGEGELAVVRRPTKYIPAYHFLPCQICYGFFPKSCLSVHVSSCKLKEKSSVTSNSSRHALMLLAPFCSRSTDKKKVNQLLGGLKETAANTGVTEIIEQDDLIKLYAEHQLARLGNPPFRSKDINYVRTKMRSIARLVKALRRRVGHYDTTISDYLKPEYYDDIVECVRELGRTNSQTLPVILGNYVKQLNLLKIAQAIKTENNDMLAESEKFNRLYEATWKNTVSSVALRSMRMKKLTKNVELPLTIDIVRLTKFIKTAIKETGRPDKEELKKLVLAGLILFNKRRPMEVAEMTFGDFKRATRARDDEYAQEIVEGLSQSEKMIAKRITVAEVRGKSTRQIRKVFVLIDNVMRFGIEKLKSMVELPCDTTYIFTRKSKNQPMDGTKALKEVVNQCTGLKYPERLHSRKLRQYLATTSQMLNMRDNELQMLADHMGHDLNIHTSHYRLMTNIIERSKVAKILLAVDSGFWRKSSSAQDLESITINDIPTVVEDDIEEDQSNCDDSFSRSVAVKEKKDVDGRTDLKGGQDNVLSLYGKLKKRSSIGRKRWTQNEERIFLQSVLQHLNEGDSLPKEVIKKLLCCLPDRTEAQIRAHYSNYLTKKQRFSNKKSDTSPRKSLNTSF